LGNIAALGSPPDEQLAIIRVKTIKSYDPRWVGAFAGEAARLRIALGPLHATIDHIGSTAVNDLVAKPVIDILIQISDLKNIDERASRFEDMGYEARGEYGIAGRRYFSKATKDEIVKGFHVHIFEQGSYQARRHIAFRDCMRLRPDLAKAYSNLKRGIADRDGQLPPDYTDRKKTFVDLIADIAVLQSDPVTICKSIVRYIASGDEKDGFDVGYHKKWMHALEKEAQRLGVALYKII
jgi:GrpB-like predicted nucleotidyltransferase (UPF0157 family)